MADRRLWFGGADLGNIGGVLSDDDAAALLDTAWDLGIRAFDTAPHYGLGLAERRRGAFLRNRPRGEVTVATKVGRLLRPSPDTVDRPDHGGFAVPADQVRVWDFSEAGIRRALVESLERLGLDRADVLLLHDPDEQDAGLVGPAITGGAAALARLRSEGLVGAVGIGSKSVDALLAGVRTGLLDMVVVAGRYTLLEQPAAARLLPECAERGVTVLAAGVFNSGLLATPAPGAGDRYEYGQAPAALVDRARELARICTRHGVELPAAALQFPLRHPAVHALVLGARTPAQLAANVARLGVRIPDELWPEVAA